MREHPQACTVKPARRRTIALMVGLALLACVAAILIAVFVINANNASKPSNLHDVTAQMVTADDVERVVAAFNSDAPALKDIDSASVLAIPGSSEVISYDLSSKESVSLGNDSKLASVRSAISDIQEQGDCGFVLIDLSTAKCLAYNADEPLYIASAAKAPLTYFALLSGAGEDEGERASIEDAIVNSDNDSYEDFAYTYVDMGYLDWLAEREVYHDDPGDLYPPMSARSLASIWGEILKYVDDGSERATWFAGLLASTETSFLRDALRGIDAAVMNKGGWIAEDEYFSVTDAGIVEADGRVYIISVVTSQPDEGITEDNVTTLIRALYDARDLVANQAS